MCRTQKMHQQAIYCYSKAISVDQEDVNAIWDRSYLYAEMRLFKKALSGYYSILSKRPGELQVIKEIVKTHLLLNQTDNAQALLEQCLAEMGARKQPTDLGIVNMLAEIYMMSVEFEPALTLLVKSLAEHSSSAQTFPVDLRVKIAICDLHMLKYEDAEAQLAYLFVSNPEEYGDLYLDVADTYVEINRFRDAIRVLE